jgi:hypothetical protein
VASTGAPQKLLSRNGSRTSVQVVAHLDNPGRVWVGFDDTVANDNTEGIPLEPGDSFDDAGPNCYSGEVWINSADVLQQVVFVEVG